MWSTPIYLLALCALLCACTAAETGESKAEAARLLAKGKRQIADKQLREAIISLRMVLHRDSSNVDAIAGLAEIYRQQQRTYAADGYQRKVIFETYEEGMQLLEAGDKAAAIEAFKHAVELHPTHTLALIELGRLAAGDNLTAEAIAYYEQAREANPHYAQGRIILGDAYLASGRFAEARIEFEHAMGLNATASAAQLGLAQALAGEELWPEAVHQFEKALLLNPASEKARSGLQHARSQM